MLDPLDVGKPSLKRWEEFRAQYSATLLTYWVFRDLQTDAADAIADLWGRLQSSLCDYPELMQRDATEQGEAWDGYVPLHGGHDNEISWLHVDDLDAVYNSLFPHNLRNASIDSAIARGVVVGLHSSLETYAKAVGLETKNGLVNAIRDHLSMHGQDCSADLVESLDDCDATRHVIIHNRGCVDETYIRRVRNSPLQLEEVRVLSDALIESFSRAVFSVATLLKVLDDGESRL